MRAVNARDRNFSQPHGAQAGCLKFPSVGGVEILVGLTVPYRQT
jgi:hypothetical protein